MREHEFLLLYYLRLRRKNVFTRAKTYIHNIDATVDLVKLLIIMVKADTMKKIAGVLKLFRVQQLTHMPSALWNRSEIYWITFLVTNTSKKHPIGSETIKQSRIEEFSRFAGSLTKYACRSPRLSSRLKCLAPRKASVLSGNDSRKVTSNLLLSIFQRQKENCLF